MMPTVRINDAILTDISLLSTWFRTETPDETITHIVKLVMAEIGLEQDTEGARTTSSSRDELVLFNVAPSLLHTKVIRATIAGTPIQNPTWLAILHTMIAKVKDKGLEGESLVQELRVRSVVGKSNDRSYRISSELGLSVQRQSAPAVWKETNRLAQKWGIPVTVEFIWKQKVSAKRRGKGGVLRSGHPR